ncbi:hypothetical protein Cob_v011806 [Colletotrichum orbiculare MAFF 240422]|uniref:Uncharacterized protein n=1 Tax=Colletotrichum orbiculare (strain 104-T / ATCC 96160 / CBS 514.97 / LARS 414 / MAFF 240422) TaxID=1213857 RepID=A0A484FCT9_COLOR|nr:hypothetical protein Cob_v011806 [Colletotrichum orbiculare MAFF 240422]
MPAIEIKCHAGEKMVTPCQFQSVYRRSLVFGVTASLRICSWLSRVAKPVPRHLADLARRRGAPYWQIAAYKSEPVIARLPFALRHQSGADIVPS